MSTKINGIKIYTAGKKTNKPVVFVHGFPFDNTMWKNQIDELKKDYYCVSFDVRGLGKSEVGDGQYTMSRYTSDLIYLIDELKLEKPVLCGMSMGGYIVLRVAEVAPEKVGGLILIDTKSEADNDHGKCARAAAIEKINNFEVKQFMKDFIPPLFSEKNSESHKKTMDSIIRKASNSDALGVKGGLIAMLSRTDTTKALRKFNFPVLLLCGEDDKLTTPEVMQKMAKKIKNSDFYVVPKAGHMSPVENPDFVNKKLIKFLGMI